MPRVRHDPGERCPEGEEVLVHHAEDRVLGLVDRCVAPTHGGERRLRSADRVQGEVLVGHDHPVGDPGGGWLEADLPVDVVGVEEGAVEAGGLRCQPVVAHVRGPVLVVEVGDEDLPAGEHGRALLDVDAGRVGDVVALAFQPADHVVVTVEEIAGAVPARVGAVERDLVGALAVRGAPVVEALAAPDVVGLIGREGDLEDEIGRGAVVPQDEDDVVGGSRAGDQLGQIDAADPIRPGGQGVTDGPVGLHRAGDRVRCGDRLVDAGEAHDRFHETGAGAAVPAHAVDLNVVAGRDRPHMQVHGLIAVVARLTGVAADVGVNPDQRLTHCARGRPNAWAPGGEQLVRDPGAGAGLGVLLCDRGVGTRLGDAGVGTRLGDGRRCAQGQRRQQGERHRDEDAPWDGARRSGPKTCPPAH